MFCFLGGIWWHVWAAGKGMFFPAGLEDADSRSAVPGVSCLILSYFIAVYLHCSMCNGYICT